MTKSEVRAVALSKLELSEESVLFDIGAGTGSVAVEAALMARRGHEFHYWESEAPGQDWTARKPESDRSWKCVHGENGSYWGFPHLYYPSNPAWLERWLNRCLAYRARRDPAVDEALMGTSFQKKTKSNR